MDTSKWKSVLLPVELYQELKAITHAEGRTLSGQLRLIFTEWRETQKAVRNFKELCKNEGLETQAVAEELLKLYEDE